MLSLALRTPVIRNTGFNILGQGIPLLIGAVSIPFIARALTVEAFGLMGIVWVVLGYSSLFELGLGRATIKNVSHLLAQGRMEDLPAAYWTPYWIQVGLGLLGMCLGVALALTFGRFLGAPELHPEIVLAWLAIGLLPILPMSIVRSALEGGHHFGVVNFLKGIGLSLMFLVPLVGAVQGWPLLWIVTIMVLCQNILFLAYCAVAGWKYPILKTASMWPDIRLIRQLVSFGGWTTAYQLCMLLTYADRLLLGALSSLSSLAYYTAAKEIVSRVWIFPWSLSLVLFPTFSGMDANDEREEIKRLYDRAMAGVLVVMGPLALLMNVVAQPFLGFYLGPEYAEHATVPLRILSIGLFVNSLAFVPYSLFQGLGRPDVPAKVALSLAPGHLLALALMVPVMGATGAAIAWLLWGGTMGITLAILGRRELAR